MVEKLEKWKDVQHLLDADIQLFEKEHELGRVFPQPHKELEVHVVTGMLQQWDEMCGLLRADMELFKSEHQLWCEAPQHSNKQEVD